MRLTLNLALFLGPALAAAALINNRAEYDDTIAGNYTTLGEFHPRNLYAQAGGMLECHEPYQGIWEAISDITIEAGFACAFWINDECSRSGDRANGLIGPFSGPYFEVRNEGIPGYICRRWDSTEHPSLLEFFQSPFWTDEKVNQPVKKDVEFRGVDDSTLVSTQGISEDARDDIDSPSISYAGWYRNTIKFDHPHALIAETRRSVICITQIAEQSGYINDFVLDKHYGCAFWNTSYCGQETSQETFPRYHAGLLGIWVSLGRHNHDLLDKKAISYMCRSWTGGPNPSIDEFTNAPLMQTDSSSAATDLDVRGTDEEPLEVDTAIGAAYIRIEDVGEARLQPNEVLCGNFKNEGRLYLIPFNLTAVIFEPFVCHWKMPDYNFNKFNLDAGYACAFWSLTPCGGETESHGLVGIHVGPLTDFSLEGKNATSFMCRKWSGTETPHRVEFFFTPF